MARWHDAITDIGNPQGSAPFTRRRWRPWQTRVPVVMLGAPGSGKSGLWSALTGRPVLNAMSALTDEGYLFDPDHDEAITLTTLPGQRSDIRRRTQLELFGNKTIVRGVIFVATFGFNHVWSNELENVAQTLNPYSLSSLRDRSNLKELDYFEEACRLIGEKRLAAPRETWPQWLLVVVNKVDLYWNDIDAARRYYAPGSGSDFDQIATELLTRLGTVWPFEYDVVPCSATSADYQFPSHHGLLQAPTMLSHLECTASLQSLNETIRRLDVGSP